MRPDADLCVFDEPSSALDAAAQNDLFERLTKGNRPSTGERKSTIIFVTHRLSTVKQAHKVAMFENGVRAQVLIHFRSVGSDYNCRQSQNLGPTASSLPWMDLTPRFTKHSCLLTHLNNLAKSSIYPCSSVTPHTVRTPLCLVDFLRTIPIASYSMSCKPLHRSL